MKTAPDQTAAALLEVFPRLMRFLHNGLRGYPLTLQQLRVLDALVDGERSAGAVATELGVRPSTVTGLIAPLEREGLISRRRDPVAWRVVLLDLTPAGRDVYHTITLASRRRVVRLLADLASADQAALRHALVALSAALTQMEYHSSTGGGAATPF